jgi:hypothetical protein
LAIIWNFCTFATLASLRTRYREVHFAVKTTSAIPRPPPQRQRRGEKQAM